MNMELKFKDYSSIADAFSTTWSGGEMDPSTALSVSTVGQGDGESNRDGRKYTIQSLHIRGFVHFAAQEAQVSPKTDVICRVAVVLDKQTNAAQLNAEDVFLSIGSNEDHQSFRNLQFSKRFTVLKDKWFRIPLGQMTVNEGSVDAFANGGYKSLDFRWDFKFPKGINVNTKATTAVVGAVTDNSIHVIGVASNTSALLTYESRVRFTG